MNSFSINSLTEEEEDRLWEIEGSLLGVGEKGAGGRSEGKSEHKGPKTSQEISKSNKENAEENRVKEARKNLKKDLEHFPFNDFSEEKLPEVIEKYSSWVLKSLPDKYPFFTNLETEIEYSQSRSSGPGGQNVNKTSTAVTAKHLLTGIYARSEDSREVPINKGKSLSKLLTRLESHIKNWSIYVKNTPLDERRDEIISFVTNMRDEKTN